MKSINAVLMVSLLIVSVLAINIGTVLADDDDSENEDLDYNNNIDDDKESEDEAETEEESEDEESIEIEEAQLEGIDSDEIEETLEELEKSQISKEFKRVGFVKVWRGNGWITSEEQGKLMNGYWVVQRLAKINGETEEVEETKTVRTLGKINIAGAGNYKLVKSSTDDGNNDSIVFDVIPMNERKAGISPEETNSETTEDHTGILTLNKEKEYNNLVVWKGVLEFNEGILQGSWNVQLATDVKTMRAAKAVAIANAVKAGRVSFFERLKFWKSAKTELKENSENGEEESEYEEETETSDGVNKVKIKAKAKELRNQRLQATANQ